MSTGYKISEPNGLYYLTFQIVGKPDLPLHCLVIASRRKASILILMVIEALKKFSPPIYMFHYSILVSDISNKM